MQERHLNRFVQESEKGFLLLLFPAQSFANMAAERAELEHFTATPPQAADAVIAQHLATVRALVGGTRVRMPVANE